MNMKNKKAEKGNYGNRLLKKELSEETSEEEEELPEELSEEEDEPSEKSSEEEEIYESSPKKPKWDDQSSKKASDENLQEELHFAKLFDNVLDNILQQIKVPEEEMLAAANDIKEKFKAFNLMKVDFSLSENLCAYFYRYSLLNAAVSRNRILNAINSCKELKKCIKMSTINIISLGGGPGTDMIGFCSALQKCKNEENKTLNLTVVDLCKRWASFYNLTEFLIRESNYGNITNLFQINNICSTFMTVDLTDGTPPKKYLYDLKNADIVLLSRVLDALNYNEVQPECMLQNIVTRMKGGALLLLIDCNAKGYARFDLDKKYEPKDSELKEFSLTTNPEERFGISYAKSSKAQIVVFKKNNE